MLCYLVLSKHSKERKKVMGCYERSLIREVHFHKIIYMSDLTSIENTRIDKVTFHKLCDMLSTTDRLLPIRHMFFRSW